MAQEMLNIAGVVLRSGDDTENSFQEYYGSFDSLNLDPDFDMPPDEVDAVLNQPPGDSAAPMDFNGGAAAETLPHAAEVGSPHGAMETEEDQLESPQHHDEAAAAALELGQLEVKLYPSGTLVDEEHLYDDMRTRHSKLIADAIRQFRHYAREILEVDGSEQICLHLGNRMRCFFITQQTTISKTARVLTDLHDARPTAWYAPAGTPMEPEKGPVPYGDRIAPVGPRKARTGVPSMFLPCTLLVFVEKGPGRCAARLFPGAVGNKREGKWKDATLLKTIRSKLKVRDDADMFYCVLALKEGKAPKDGYGPTPKGAAPTAAKDKITGLYIDITG